MNRETASRKKERAQKVYQKLRRSYPKAEIALKYDSDIHLLVAVILSAQCTDKKVNEVTIELFKKYKTVEDFANAKLPVLEKEIYQTGFYRAKARNIIASAKLIRRDFHGEIPRTMEEILRLPGVARKTGNVVLGNAYGIVDGVAVDTHVRRLTQRLGFSTHNDPVKIEKDLMELFPKRHWFQLTYTLIDHGRAICKAPTPKCDICPVADICPTGRKNLGLGSLSQKKKASRAMKKLVQH